jgi:hypothetical protein
MVMIHLSSEAVRTGSPVVEVEDSLTAFVRSLGLNTGGRTILTWRARPSSTPPRRIVATARRASWSLRVRAGSRYARAARP